MIFITSLLALLDPTAVAAEPPAASKQATQRYPVPGATGVTVESTPGLDTTSSSAGRLVLFDARTGVLTQLSVDGPQNPTDVDSYATWAIGEVKEATKPSATKKIEIGGIPGVEHRFSYPEANGIPHSAVHTTLQHPQLGYLRILSVCPRDQEAALLPGMLALRDSLVVQPTPR